MSEHATRVCIVGASGKLGRNMVQHALDRNRARRIDFALFMVEALQNDELVHEAPAIVGCQTPSALAHAARE
jgi:uncharacterized protein YbjT (DUF2867 family)